MCAWKGSESWARVPALAVSQHALEIIKKQFERAPCTVGNAALLQPHRGANGKGNREEKKKQKKLQKSIDFFYLCSN